MKRTEWPYINLVLRLTIVNVEAKFYHKEEARSVTSKRYFVLLN